MIYLDYSATPPVDEKVLDSYCKVTRDYIGNANSIHTLGVKSKELLMEATNQIAKIFNCHPKELIFTSGASESNTTAIKGVAFKYANRVKHIITSKLEHKSVLEVMSYLSSIGYEVDFVKILPSGQIDLKNLEELIRKDTVLISICAFNSETGFKQPLKTIRQVINKKNPNVIFHSDLTQALGKTHFYLNDLDLASFSSHKIYAPKGIGILYKKRNLEIDTLIYGTTENCPFRGGTPALPLIVAFSKAIRLMNDINTVLSFIDGCLQYDEIYNLRLKDVGDEIHFTIQRGKYDVPVEEISKLDENTMRMLYAAIAARYSGHIELGATMERKNGDIIWNLAPVIGDRTMIELISGDPKDQEWFYEELKEATKQKGLK